jgi:integrase
VLGGELETNPCASVSLPKGLPKTTRRAASKEDEEKVRNDAGAWLFNVIALNTGLRKGEILALQWSDIDLDEDLIYVTKSVAHDGDRPVIDRPKTDAAIRIVPIVPDLKERLLKEPDRSPERFVISDDGNSPLTNRRYQTLSTREKKRAGTTFTAHRLRHSFATNAFEVGLDAKSIQEVIGHKQISTTLNTYTDFRKESVKRAAAVLAKVGEKADEKDH